MAMSSGLSLLCKVCDALGIDWENRPVQRVVIDLSVDRVAKVYIQEVVATRADDGIVAAMSVAECEILPFAEVIVDERTGDVTTR